MEYITLLDFTLDLDDMNKIAKLDLGKSEIVNHYDPNFIKMIKTISYLE